MTMLSWSVIEYSAKYEAAGELNHVKDIIKWGTDYFLKSFNSTADSIDQLVMQVNTMELLIISYYIVILHVPSIGNLKKCAMFCTSNLVGFPLAH